MKYGYVIAAAVWVVGLPLFMIEEHKPAAASTGGVSIVLEPSQSVYASELVKPAINFPTAPADEVKSMERTCLALNIYHEARGEKPAGQVAVALVTKNRVKSSRFPSSYCDVVKQDRSGPSLGGCQFSWYCDGKSDIPTDTLAWAIAVNIANGVIDGHILDTTGGADHYYAHNKTKPWWRTSMTFTQEIGGHSFYRSQS